MKKIEIVNIEDFNSRVKLQERNIKKNHPDLYNLLNSIYPDDYSIQEKLYLYYRDMSERPLCKHCGEKPVKFISFNLGYRLYCSARCCALSEERRVLTANTNKNKTPEERAEIYKKIHDTTIARHGAIGFADPKQYEKAKKTNLERYGVTDPIKNEEIQEKAKQTKLEKYGDPYYSNREKAKQTKLEKYGDPYYSDLEKSKQTRLKRYGNPNYTNFEKIKRTKMNKYGDPYYSNPEKAKKTNLERYGAEYIMQAPELKDKNKKSNINFYISKHNLVDIVDGNWICKCPHPNCDKCEEKQYIINSSQYYARLEKNIEPCTNLLPIGVSNKDTNIELFVKDILDKYNINYETNIRSIISPLELDIYIPDRNIAIECNGIYWHNINSRDNNYHINKYIKCKEKGIQLISIWEDWVNTTPEIVESIILSKLGIYKTKIYARKCDIREVSTSDTSKFLNDNHIQGSTPSTVKLGLYYDNVLVSLMTFSHRSKLSGAKDIHINEWELSRFCNLLNTTVIGGASKLLNYFIKKYNPTSIISFSSNDISDGGLYKTLGFTSDTNITKAYWYVHKDKYIRYHRSKFCKGALKKMGYDIEGKTEDEIMRNLPYFKIYDSGHIKHTLLIDNSPYI